MNATAFLCVSGLQTVRTEKLSDIYTCNQLTLTTTRQGDILWRYVSALSVAVLYLTVCVCTRAGGGCLERHL